MIKLTRLMIYVNYHSYGLTLFSTV